MESIDIPLKQLLECGLMRRWKGSGAPQIQALPHRKLGLPPNIFFLGVVSLLTDMSSEMIFTLVPLFLSNVLGASTIIIGLVGGSLREHGRRLPHIQRVAER